MFVWNYFLGYTSLKKVKDNFSGFASLSPLDCGAQSTRISGREDPKYNSQDDLQNINTVVIKKISWVNFNQISN